AHRTLAGWQVLDLDGRWVPITTKVCHDSVRPYYIFNDDVYGGSSAIHLFRYLSQHPEFGRFAEVSSPEFSYFKIRAVYALNASVGFTAVNGEFYDDEAGDWVSSGIAFQNEEVDVYAREIPGMRFDHWTVTIGGTQIERFPTGPESDRAVSDITWERITIYIRDHEDVVVTAHYVESGEEDASDTYNVVITATAGGTIIGSASGTYHEDDMIEILAVPSYGYIFIGWYCGNPDYPDWGDLDEEYPGVTYWIYGDVKFTAVFERIDVSEMYTVFVENGYVHGYDSDLCMSAIYRYGGDRVYLIPDPSADPLHKWVITELDENGVPADIRIEHVDPDDVSYIHYEDCDVSVVGVFESEVDSRTVTFASNGGSGTMSDLIVCEDSERLTLPANGFTRENYDFLGWSTNPEAVEATYKAGATIDLGSDDIHLYAVWKAASHNLSFSVANGIYGYRYYYDWVNGTNISVTFGQENTVPAVDQLLSYHRGFDIIGWTDPEGNVYAADGTAIVPYSVYRLTAVVQFWTVTVHFESSSPAGEMPDAQLTFNGSSNGYLPDDHVLFNRTGYSFAGWYLDESSSSNVGSSLNCIDMDKLFQKSGVTNGGEVTLHASWSVKYYNLYYEYNLDGIYGYYPSSAALINGGHRLHTIPASTPLPEGVTFVEWNTRQDGSGNSYSANELINTAFIAREFTGNDSVLHLYAIWSGPIVKYDLDGGDGKLPDCKSYRSSELISGYTLLLQEPYSYVFQLPTKGDLRLAGWSLTRGGEIYDGNDRISGVELADDGSLTLYAVYAPVSQNA
ncbi:MAG: InlB B-repeat-containing protein, partial [archaeon]|nr:InlB B-repeat-containing protein [archaeon]